jgi:3-oxoacyl-[acyl-carrier protein] reductase
MNFFSKDTNSMLLENKVAIITGSSRGIGRRIAEVFAANGASVIINYFHSDADAQNVVQTIKEQTNSTSLLIKADVSTPDGANRLVDAAIKRFGHLDILVNNAGITIRGSTLETEEKDWDLVMAVNLKGPFLCAKAAIPSMLNNKGGVILNIASIRGITGSSNSMHYAVSKSGVITMTKSLAMEFAPFIRVNAIAPGYTMTDLHSHLDSNDIAKIKSSIPLKRFGSVDDIAQTALFLSSNNADYITGETIVVSGGLVIR